MALIATLCFFMSSLLCCNNVFSILFSRLKYFALISSNSSFNAFFSCSTVSFCLSNFFINNVVLAFSAAAIPAGPAPAPRFLITVCKLSILTSFSSISLFKSYASYSASTVLTNNSSLSSSYSFNYLVNLTILSFKAYIFSYAYLTPSLSYWQASLTFLWSESGTVSFWSSDCRKLMASFLCLYFLVVLSRDLVSFKISSWWVIYRSLNSLSFSFYCLERTVKDSFYALRWLSILKRLLLRKSLALKILMRPLKSWSLFKMESMLSEEIVRFMSCFIFCNPLFITIMVELCPCFFETCLVCFNLLIKITEITHLLNFMRVKIELILLGITDSFSWTGFFF